MSLQEMRNMRHNILSNLRSDAERLQAQWTEELDAFGRRGFDGNFDAYGQALFEIDFRYRPRLDGLIYHYVSWRWSRPRKGGYWELLPITERRAHIAKRELNYGL